MKHQKLGILGLEEFGKTLTSIERHVKKYEELLILKYRINKFTALMMKILKAIREIKR